MERSEILSAMGELKLYGMKAAYDEIITTAVKRQHEPTRSSCVTTGFQTASSRPTTPSSIIAATPGTN